MSEGDSRISEARIEWKDGAPYSMKFDDVYFSGDGAAETEHVFLKGNDLAARFAGGGTFSVGELGFGTGLNFLKTWALWKETPKAASARLRFMSAEAFPISCDGLERAHAAWPDLAPLAERLRAALPPLAPGFHQIDIANDVTLVLAFGDAHAMLAQAEGRIDAWFLDGFSPAKNPNMWRPEIFEEVARLSRPGATAATFTVAGDVRRALEAAGFTVEKRAGFGRKREMLAARIDMPRRSSRRAPWFQNAREQALPAGATLAIIGGGIAGASLAREARRAGLSPTIFDPKGLAAGASGNPAGLIMPRLDLGGSPAAQFFVSAYLHTVRLLNDLQGITRQPAHPRNGVLFNPCGVLLGARDDAEKARHEKILGANLLPEGWIEAREDGLFFPQAGVLDPRAFIAALARESRVVHGKVARIASGDAPAVMLDNGSSQSFDAIVIANGVDALLFEQARSLPLTPSLGQVDWFPEAAPPPNGIAFGPYAAPVPARGLIIGATYATVAAGRPPTPSEAATRENIAAVARFAPEVAAGLELAAARPRAAIRCQTPDRLPIAGPLPDLGFCGAEYDDLRLGKQRPYPPAESIPGVWILAGLGSRGLVTAPLAAAMVIADMTGAVSPAPAALAEATHPARFFIRDLKGTRSRRR